MSTRIEFVLLCDGADCASRVVSEHSLQDARDMARRSWWSLYGSDEAYCPDCHRPLPGMIRDCPDCRTARDAQDEWGAAAPEPRENSRCVMAWPDLESLA